MPSEIQNLLYSHSRVTEGGLETHPYVFDALFFPCMPKNNEHKKNSYEILDIN